MEKVAWFYDSAVGGESYRCLSWAVHTSILEGLLNFSEYFSNMQGKDYHIGALDGGRTMLLSPLPQFPLCSPQQGAHLSYHPEPNTDVHTPDKTCTKKKNHQVW